mmetsp:Transcript_16723/g.32293  ORF Transcript_16723/g.32293 Transcript_16723/m.32293 type:complete len:205 (-) Transcript_16723:187-801(-)
MNTRLACKCRHPQRLHHHRGRYPGHLALSFRSRRMQDCRYQLKKWMSQSSQVHLRSSNGKRALGSRLPVGIPAGKVPLRPQTVQAVQRARTHRLDVCQEGQRSMAYLMLAESLRASPALGSGRRRAVTMQQRASIATFALKVNCGIARKRRLRGYAARRMLCKSQNMCLSQDLMTCQHGRICRHWQISSPPLRRCRPFRHAKLH